MSYDWTETYKHWDAWQDPEDAAAGHAKHEHCDKPGCSHDHGHGHKQHPTGCDHDHSAERKIYELSTADKIKACQEFKLMGNLFFKEGQYFRASEKYRMVLVYYEYAFPDTPEETAALDTLRLECLLNLAQSKLRTRQYDEVIDNCTQAVISDPSSVKALYRRAQAHRAKDNFTEAAADIRAAIAIAPSDRSSFRCAPKKFYAFLQALSFLDTLPTCASCVLRSEAAAITARLRRYEDRRKVMVSAMFGGPSPVDDSPAVDVDVYQSLLKGRADIAPE